MSSKPTAKAAHTPAEAVSLPSPEASTGNLSSSEPMTAEPVTPEPITEPTAIDTIAPIPERRALNLKSTKSRPGLPGLIPRPIDPSPVQVSHTVSIAGTRPVMADPRRAPDVLRQAPKILNRPIAPNETEDSNRLLEYLD
jgi:hypothetical protein